MADLSYEDCDRVAVEPHLVLHVEVQVVDAGEKVAQAGHVIAAVYAPQDVGLHVLGDAAADGWDLHGLLGFRVEGLGDSGSWFSRHLFKAVVPWVCAEHCAKTKTQFREICI